MKLPHQIEYRALCLIEALEAGRPTEEADALASIWRSWPAPNAATARRLAAEANAARGRSILWLVGAKAGAEMKRFESWFAEIVPYFDGLAPRVTAYALPAGANTAVALLIETGRAPFVVRRSAGATWETPWFDAASRTVRSAGRPELIKLLSPVADLPGLELLEAELTFYKNPHSHLTAKTAYRWTLDGSLYVVPRGEARLVIPLHTCRASVAMPGAGFLAEGSDCSFTADKNSPAIRVTETALLIEGLGRFFVYACGATSAADLPWTRPVNVRVDFTPAGGGRSAVAGSELRPETVTEPNQAGRWRL
jgi:hypothetical protein